MLDNRLSFFALAAVAAVSASAEVMDRPVGIRIGQRMTLKPYLSFSASYNSNVAGNADGAEDVTWTVNPGLTLDYLGEQLKLTGNVWYQYNAYSKSANSSDYNYHSYGEELTGRWTDSLPGEKGWALMLSERYLCVNQASEYTDSEGRDYSSDHNQFMFAGGLQRRFSNHLHADVNANYYWLDYVDGGNQRSNYGLYGWDRWGVGGEVGYAFTPWTDLLIAGSYQDYSTQNRKGRAYEGQGVGYGQSSGSKGVTAQIGLGSYATRRITYRALGGWTSYQYDEGGEDSSGFSYTVGANWIISETWKTMLLGTSYYQPTEREFGSSQRVDSLSWGITHAMVQGKLNGMFDVAYRREGREYSAVDSYDYDLDSISFRLGLTYILSRYLQFYTNFEYRKSYCEDSRSVRGSYYDYDRFRGTLGVRFTY